MAKFLSLSLEDVAEIRADLVSVSVDNVGNPTTITDGIQVALVILDRAIKWHTHGKDDPPAATSAAHTTTANTVILDEPF